jgi:hypothetical protein
VIALCKELEMALDSPIQNIRGLIDADYSILLDDIPHSGLLFLTEFSCLECYALTERTLQKFCNLYLRRDIPISRFEEMFGMLTELFLMRASKLALSQEAPWIDTFTRLCKLKGGSVVFNRDEFLVRPVNASGGKLSRDKLDKEISRLRPLLNRDWRHSINGHDLAELVSWYSRKLGVDSSVARSELLSRALLASVETTELATTALFVALLMWATI